MMQTFSVLSGLFACFLYFWRPAAGPARCVDYEHLTCCVQKEDGGFGVCLRVKLGAEPLGEISGGARST